MNVLAMFIFIIQTLVAERDKRVITTLKYSKFSITPTIVNGKPASEGQFPYLVSFKEPVHKLEPEKTMWKNLCGGSIISAEKVLSAAHCFEENSCFYARFPNMLRVVAGDLRNDIVHSGETETSEQAQWRKIKKVILHPRFNFPADDIAVVFVDQPWIFNKRVNFIKVAKVPADYKGECISAGYGRTGHHVRDNITPVLLSASISVLPRNQCSSAWEMDMKNYICTDSALTDVARGDSGGPLACQRTGDPNEENDEGVLVGVVSGKNYDKTTLYTRVSAYHEWVADPKVSDGTKCEVQMFLIIIPLIVIYPLF